MRDKNGYNAYMRVYLPKRMEDIRTQAIKDFGSKCSRCGDSDGPFEFDHIDPKEKAIEIGELWKYGKDKRDAELSKCQLLCIPCHKKKTCEDHGWSYSVKEHGLPGSHKYCKCRVCLDAWMTYQKHRHEVVGKPLRKSRSKGKKNLIHKRGSSEIMHGTRAGYLKEVRLGLATCEDCKKANTQYTQQRKTRIRERSIGV